LRKSTKRRFALEEEIVKKEMIRAKKLAIVGIAFGIFFALISGILFI